MRAQRGSHFFSFFRGHHSFGEFMRDKRRAPTSTKQHIQEKNWGGEDVLEAGWKIGNCSSWRVEEGRLERVGERNSLR
jgi:hypothetical protein